MHFLPDFVVAATLTLTVSLSQAHSLEARQSASTISNCANQGEYAITFDDGPYNYNSQIVQELGDYGAMGTFFVNGLNYGCIYDYAEDLQHAYSAGHIIGSHTWSHADIASIPEQELEDELTMVETALQKILGVKPALFRPPYGSYNQAALNVLARRGYHTILWSMDTEDSIGASVDQSKAEYDQSAQSFPAPGMSLQHETYQTTAEQVLPYGLQKMVGAGYTLTTVSQCLGIQPYQKIYTSQLPVRDETWTCDAPESKPSVSESTKCSGRMGTGLLCPLIDI